MLAPNAGPLRGSVRRQGTPRGLGLEAPQLVLLRPLHLGPQVATEDLVDGCGLRGSGVDFSATEKKWSQRNRSGKFGLLSERSLCGCVSFFLCSPRDSFL